jgi:hypothetical protein
MTDEPHADLEALARRFEVEPTSDELRDAIATAFGWSYIPGDVSWLPPKSWVCVRLLPDFPRSIDAAASLLSPEWRCDVSWIFADTVWAEPRRTCGGSLEDAAVDMIGTASGDHAEARARCAAAIRVLAMEKKP